MPSLTSQPEPVRARSSEAAAPEMCWQGEIKAAIRDAEALCQQLDLPPETISAAASGASQFPVFVPPAYLARIKPGDPADPLLRQVLPLAEEGNPVAGFTVDPVDDAAAEQAPGLLHKYQGRVLLITTGVCAVHCRYCFRRHYPYETAPHSDAAWDVALDAIVADESIHEVILSGGDPLMLVDSRLEMLVDRIEKIAHVKRLRIHTRLPIMVPSRITDFLMGLLSRERLKSVVVLHANHAQELDDEVAAACQKLQSVGVVLLNQAVLLRGVNDSVEAQCDLSERLIELSITPYYLHQLDRVSGAAHFEVPIEEGKRIVTEMRQRLPGYLVPRYAIEQPGEASKTILL
ncbi:EF-P beta-lysylation protein EpmB [Adhaeretor mobilis]|uniref:L-lysine 2,3-aminomutase n=1 Tax=Adhaeretor mobilis TaxID=1930276 RepID=A0A517N1N4_9BACT|nr:EF-P beta-lysylation protein EpmB [Adhaeretor mobilis]QDT01050.1 L-lysine 2,3-aminomutase [Adhaeretor mobilis]